MKFKAMTIRLPLPVAEELKAEADERLVSMNAIITEALRERAKRRRRAAERKDSQ